MTNEELDRKVAEAQVTTEQLKHWFEYKDGHLYWDNPIDKRIKKGQRFGNIDSEGYVRGAIKRKHYREHRLVYQLFHGSVPQQLDHINGVKTDNRIENLRPATPSENLCNKPKQSNNTTGYKGVSYCKRDKRYWARICKDGIKVSLGYFDNPHDAGKAYQKAAKEIHGDFCHDK